MHHHRGTRSLLATWVILLTAWSTSQALLDSGASAAVPPPPVVSSVTPSSGPNAGGTLVTITGTGFDSSSQVWFGTLRTASVTFLSATELRASAPPESAGTVDITVVVGSQQSAVGTQDQFTYIAPPPPVVSMITPRTGPRAGGTEVTIFGSGFTSSSTVSFGTLRTANVVFVSTSRLHAVSPPESQGMVDVRVTNGSRVSPAVANDRFTYKGLAPPAVIRIAPHSGPANGGTVVTISGSGFTPRSTVSFGAFRTAYVTYQSSTSLLATSPPESAGTVDVRVVNFNGAQESRAVQADRFAYN
jgi:hypothetical protein